MIPHISTGDIFRSHIKGGTELGMLAKSYNDRGVLVPDDIVFQIVNTRLQDADAQTGALYDGFPRTVRQAELLEGWLGQRSRHITAAINLVVPDLVLLERLAGRRSCTGCQASYHVTNNPPRVEGVCDKCGAAVIQRKDDHEDTVRERIEVYHSQCRTASPSTPSTPTRRSASSPRASTRCSRSSRARSRP